MENAGSRWSQYVKHLVSLRRAETGPEDRSLSRLSFYLVFLAWIMLGLYVYSLRSGASDNILEYFLSTEQSGVKFRALMLLAPFVLIVISYLVNDRTKLFRQNVVAGEELRKQAAELERANERLTQQAFYDTLTNLPNRALFTDRVRASLERKKRYHDHSLAILFLDLDRFKVINDSLGHIMGDQLLGMVANRLKKHARSIDTVARFGGDEFAVLLEEIKEISSVTDIVTRLQGEMTSPFNVFGHQIFVTISIGIVLSTMAEYKSPDELLRDADTAMYQAKSRGKACYAIFDKTMHAEASMALQLEMELRRALERGEFTVFYQPIVSVGDDKTMGFEALLRWQHPERGIITPMEFIAVAEETGMIFVLGPWVLREACRQLKTWQERIPGCDGLTVSVNVSSKVFSQPDFGKVVEDILSETGVDGSCLRLEIIERMLIEDAELAADLINRLKKLDVRFDIDDFGTGYSALNYLRHFPIKGLKIDGSFISALASDGNNAKIVETIVTLGRDLGLDVIAEGVETVEQLDIFRSMKGEYAQGYYLCRPMDSMAAEKFLALNAGQGVVDPR